MHLLLPHLVLFALPSPGLFFENAPSPILYTGGKYCGENRGLVILYGTEIRRNWLDLTYIFWHSCTLPPSDWICARPNHKYFTNTGEKN